MGRDSASLSRFIGVPFQGSKLFVHALETLLIKMKDEHMVLPFGKEEHSKNKAQSFCLLGYVS